MTTSAKSLFAAVCSALVLGLLGCQDSDPLTAQAGLLIQYATIVDGAGALAFHGDIRVVGERISVVSDTIEPVEGDRLIDATGLVVSPGFIDMHAHVSNIH